MSFLNKKKEKQKQIWRYGQVVKPPPFHGGVPSSILGSATNYMPSVRVGEGAALKAVGLKGLAGSNPVDGAKMAR